ncbi:hypothetical protein CFK37_18440 [Virgibacillus phasianinus]|uniref:Uncharacterized protein n=1 Tax=Virgibacillus phasianinus TaxID=2017483 RepID=A0A220U8C6_9BACI|nr:hypothetical protein [Virgibacillus phasianinus]ASK63993.1 hypothetical protein CFK37_18440 [Virgibacillus phasianinus]
MNIDVDSLMTLLILWGTPTFMVVRTYLKMDSDDRNSAKKDFKSLHFIFTIGFLVIGYFFASFGNLLALTIIKFLGIGLVIIGGIVSTIYKRRENKKRSLLIPVFITIAIYCLF